MMTKTEFFALLNDENNRIGVTAHIAARTNSNGTQSLFIGQTGAPNTGLSTHKAHTTTIAAFNKYNTWLNEWFASRAAEADHAEALTFNEEVDAGAAIMKNKAVRAYWLTCDSMNVVTAFREWEAMHAEALEMNTPAAREGKGWADQTRPVYMNHQQIVQERMAQLERPAPVPFAEQARKVAAQYGVQIRFAAMMVATGNYETKRRGAELIAFCLTYKEAYRKEYPGMLYSGDVLVDQDHFTAFILRDL